VTDTPPPLWQRQPGGAPNGVERDRWLGIELRHFAALEAIAQERSFRGAAARLGYVQSAVSRQIAFLEQTTGSRLIERSQGPRPVHLTETGVVLLRHADDILASLAAAKADLAELERRQSHEIRLGIFPGAPTRILSRALLALVDRNPHARVAPWEAASDELLLERLAEGSIDLTFTHLPVDRERFETCELVRIPWVLVVAVATEIDAPATVAELARLPLIMPRSERAGAPIEERLRAARPTLRVVFRFDVPQTAVELAAAGVGAAIVPRFAVEADEARTTAIDLGALLPPAALGLAWPRGRAQSTAVAELREVVCALARANGLLEME
jgi:DNA-binding transcriptional LysR family regulator